MLNRLLIILAFFAALMGLTAPLHAIGWDSDDFLIGGAAGGFLSRIGVFDRDLTFKGYLETNFVTVAGMDFDSAGNLVAVASALRTVRVYESSGAIVGGFTRSDSLLGTSNDLKVTATGSYVVATQDFGGGDGAREFEPNGAFVQQFGFGRITAAAVLPGNVLWIGGIGTGPIGVFDISSGTQLGTISVSGVNSILSLSYSKATDTVLISTNRITETDVNGNILHTFIPPINVGLSAVTRGPGGDIFATASNETVMRWHADGEFVGSVSTGAVLGGAGGIVWAGNVPEPCQAVPMFVWFWSLSRRWRIHKYSRLRSSS